MIVKSLQFSGFRNLSDNTIFPGEGINLILGDNAQGKTNLIEAIWLFCGGHSFRGAKENELLRFGSRSARLCMEFFSGGRDQKAEILYSGGKKEIEINSVSRPSGAYLSACFSAVIFSPEHLTLIKNGPTLRRRFLDGAICQQDIKYAVLLSRYSRTVLQRNALLKDMSKHRELSESLSIWDDALIDMGTKITLRRLKYLDILMLSAKEYHLGISGGKEELSAQYESAAKIIRGDTEEQIKEKLLTAFESHRREDILFGCTSCGPHRDDLSFMINEIKARSFASQGQQRSAVLSLKLSEAKLLSESVGEPPVVLLDDVLSEIDSSRREFLLSQTKDYQTFITGCDLTDTPQAENTKIFTVKDGEVI